MPTYLEAIGEARWVGPNAKIQPTLGKMIRIVLAARGIEPTPAAVRAYQNERFAQAGGETLIAELFPLPSVSVGHWIYADIGAVPYLKTRREYLAALRQGRMALLREWIDRDGPRAVVFMGVSYRDDWTALVETPMQRLADPTPGISVGRRGQTTCVVTHHPTSYGVKNGYYDTIGRLLAI